MWIMKKINKNFFYLFLIFLFSRPIFDFLSEKSIFYIEELNLSININYLFGILFVLSFVIFLFLKLRNFLHPVIFLWTIFLLYEGISLFWSYKYFYSIQELARLFTIFLSLFLGFSFIKNLSEFKILTNTLLLSSFIPGAVGIYQIFTKSYYVPNIFDPDFSYTRIQGTFFHPNPYSFYLFFILFISILYLENKKEFLKGFTNFLKSKALLFGLISIFLILIVFTFTRSVWFALGIFLFLYSLFFRKEFLFFISFFSILSYIFIPGIQERIKDILENPFNSLFWRIVLWKDVLLLYLQKPIFGWGVGSSNALIEFFRPPNLGSTYVHNDYLKILVESGIIGLFLYILIFVYLFKFLIVSYFKLRSKTFYKSLILITLFFLFSIFIISFFDNVLRVTAFQLSFWGFMGAFIKILKLENKNFKI